MFRVLTCLSGEHDWRLVVLAGFVCFLASLAAINLFHRARATAGRQRVLWIITAGAATGCGIWATHFIAMLAYDPGVAIAYDIGLTVTSLFVAAAITCIGLALAVYVRERWAAAAGGAIVGAGVACMHYLGMSAVELPGRVTWSSDLVLASIILGILFGSVSLTIAVHRAGARATLLAAIVLTIAIVSHHFTAMGAVEIIPDPTRDINAFALPPAALALAIANAAVAILGMSLAMAFADRRFREKDLQLNMAVQNMSQGLLMFDATSHLVICNQKYLEMYGLSADIVKPGCTLRTLLAHRKATGTFSGEPDRYIADLRGAIAASKIVNIETDLPDGRTIAVVNQPMAGGRWVSTHEDVTERRRAESDLRRTRAFLDTVIENVPAPIVVKEAKDHRYILVNRACEELFGISRDEMIGKTSEDVFSKNEVGSIIERDNEVLKSGGQLFIDVHPLDTPGNGRRLVTTKRLAIAGDDGKSKYLLGLLEDVTERKRAEAQIAYMAHHDTLTDLPNRAAFTERMVLTLERAKTAKDSFAILCIDLDRFKEINDVFGHAIGDGLLREVSRRMRDAAEGAFLARLGGDEFALIATDGAQPSSAEALAESLLASVANECEVDHQMLRIGVSIGVAIFPGDGTDAGTLLGNADAALYRAKAEGRASIRFFAPDMDKRLRDQRALQHDLRSATDRGEMILYYQPQALIGRDIIGFEALVRWQHPSRGLVPPNNFIPIAEESGLIIPLGEWILREACREAASWPRPLQIAVNLSPVQFRHGDLVGLVHSVLLETGLAPGRLELEITEGVLMGEFSRALSILRRLKLLGVKIAMDDFGTGYSSLSYLQSFPFDKIKIDQSFISKLARGPQSPAIIRAIIGLGRALDLPVVAEGVETEEQLAFLLQEACDEVQGFLVGRPQPIAEYDQMVGRPAALKTLSVAGN